MSDGGRICDNPKCAYHIRVNAKYAIAPHIAKVSGAGTASAGLPGYAAGGNGERK